MVNDISVTRLVLLFAEEATDMKHKSQWLQYSNDPWSQVLQYWKDTVILRESSISDDKHSLQDIFREWPTLKQPLGFTLVS